MKFKLNDSKMFISTLWYDNVDDHHFFNLKNVLPLKITWMKCFFNHLTKIRRSFHFKKNEKPLTNKGFFKTFIELLGYI